jgi:N-acetylglucosaminyl-diphospho-decaprenol L-rhamnosyltransferase
MNRSTAPRHRTAGPVYVSEPRLVLVVVNFGSHELLRRYLAWTFRNPAVAVVVVDNFRSAGDRAAIESLAEEAGWHLIRLESNLGFGVGVNRGAEKAWALGADAILVVNPDLELGSADVERIAAASAQTPDSVVAPLVVDRRHRPWGRIGRVDVRRGRLTLTDEGEGIAWLSGACFAVQRGLWEAVGGMDDDYFMYWEDVDLSVRIERAGGSLVLLSDVVVVHDVGGTQGTQGSKSSDYYYYNCRNRLVFAAKRLRKREMLIWILLTPGDIRRVVSRGEFPSRAAKWRSALPPAIRGSAAGMWWIFTNAVKTRRTEK